MLNFRKLRQDFSTHCLKEGKTLFDQGRISSVKITHLDQKIVKLACTVKGFYETAYSSELEIDRRQSMLADSKCSCSQGYDCHHLAAMLFHLEQNIHEVIVAFSEQVQENTMPSALEETFIKAKQEEETRKIKEYRKEALSSYIHAANTLSRSPFFIDDERRSLDVGSIGLLFHPSKKDSYDVQLLLRVAMRAKPLVIQNIKEFLEAIRYKKPIKIGERYYFFTHESFDPFSVLLLEHGFRYFKLYSEQEEKLAKFAQVGIKELGEILSSAFDHKITEEGFFSSEEESCRSFHSIYFASYDQPLQYAASLAKIEVDIDHIKSPIEVLLLNPSLLINNERVPIDKAHLLSSLVPGLIYNGVYHKFLDKITRDHLMDLPLLKDIAIPKPMIGTFIENALPVFLQFVRLNKASCLQEFVTLPFIDIVKGICHIQYLNGILEAKLKFVYGNVQIPYAQTDLTYEHTELFLGSDGVLARDLSEEKKLVSALFTDFEYNESDGYFFTKNEKKIIEFMTTKLPKLQDRVLFECPQNLLDQFLYDDTSFFLRFTTSPHVGLYQIHIQIEGYLENIFLDSLWECLTQGRNYLELPQGKSSQKILILDLPKLTPLIHFFDELGIEQLSNGTIEKPLWQLVALQNADLQQMPLRYEIEESLKKIQGQILGSEMFEPEPIPQAIHATLRHYQHEGIHWLNKLRYMYLNGILADDMGLGKTLQALIAIAQAKHSQRPSLIVCPTSLMYNWHEEIAKFAPFLRSLVLDHLPHQRKKILSTIQGLDCLITSYNLLQKDIDLYEQIEFCYIILDEAQHIKNRLTQNAKSAKRLCGLHRLILTGTPIENSLEELWSLFDFLMPGMLSSYDRFVEKYIRISAQPEQRSHHLAILKKKVAPFILRRMKKDVLKELPPITEIIHHVHLTDKQKQLYQSYAHSAKEELMKMVKKEGFEKIQIHVLATLTRLKQICCHPAIFAKEKADRGDSAKYELFWELVETLIEGGHKTVVFSQYTKMLSIMVEDLQEQGARFLYLDGATKNRLSVVKQFNEDPSISILLVSLKAGGTGLNLVGADTVIHYDMWWNPAVENQATDRVYRLGQMRGVSAYKLVTINTIEEKILNLQNRKKGLVTSVIHSDEETIAKLTWDEVLELLQT